MRLSLRWKLPLAVLLPLAVVAVALAFIAYRAVAQRHSQGFEARTQRLTASIASQLDAQLAAAAAMARATANAVAEAPELSQTQLDAILRRCVASDTLIYGAAIGFEPFAFDPTRRLVAPYVFRRGDALVAIDIGAESYDYTDSEWEWYARPVASKRPCWTEPYFDTDAGETLMCTYGAPIVRDGAIVGVATVDVAVKELRGRLEVDRFESGSFVLLSAGGRFIDAPDPSLVGRRLEEHLDAIGRPDLRPVADLLAHGRRGIVRAAALDGDGDTWFLVAPVPQAGWSLAVMVPHADTLVTERRQISAAMPSMIAALLAIGACVWLAARRIAGPLRALSHAAESVGRGNFAVDLPRRSDDEVGDLVGSFDRMVAALRRRGEERAAEVAPTQTAEAADGARRAARREFSAETSTGAAAEHRAGSAGARAIAQRSAAMHGAGGRELASILAPSPSRRGPNSERDSTAGVDGDAADGSDALPSSTSPIVRYALERFGADELEESGDLADGVSRRDGRLVLMAIGAAGAGLQASIAALAIRSLLRRLATTTDDPARMLAEAARLSRGLEVPVSLALALYDPATGEAHLAVAGDASIRLARHGAEAVSIGAKAPPLGRPTIGAALPSTTSALPPDSPPDATTLTLAIGDRLLLRSRAGRTHDSAQWLLERLG